MNELIEKRKSVDLLDDLKKIRQRRKLLIGKLAKNKREFNDRENACLEQLLICDAREDEIMDELHKNVRQKRKGDE